MLVDTKLDDKTTDSNGEYLLQGTDTEFSTIDPRLNIYHDCDDDWTPCQRRITISIPDKYIASGSTATNIFDMGTLQLAGKFSGETRDCIHRH